MYFERISVFVWNLFFFISLVLWIFSVFFSIFRKFSRHILKIRLFFTFLCTNKSFAENREAAIFGSSALFLLFLPLERACWLFCCCFLPGGSLSDGRLPTPSPDLITVFSNTGPVGALAIEIALYAARGGLSIGGESAVSSGQQHLRHSPRAFAERAYRSVIERSHGNSPIPRYRPGLLPWS